MVEENQHNYSATKYRTPDGVPADNVIFTITSEKKTPNSLPTTNLKVLVIKRKKWPYAGCWALPGGFSDENETVLTAAKRELQEETGIKNLVVEHTDIYSTPGRDPRGWIISSAYYALVNEKHLEHRKAADDAADEKLIDIKELLSMGKGNKNGSFEENDGKLAFDHNQIISDALKMVQRKILTTTIAKEFLPEEFTLSELYLIITTVVPEFVSIVPKEQMGNFKRKVLSRGIIEEIKDKKTNRNSTINAQLYRFTDKLPFLSIYN